MITYTVPRREAFGLVYRRARASRYPRPRALRIAAGAALKSKDTRTVHVAAR